MLWARSNLHAGGLLLHAAGQVDQAILHQAVGRVIVASSGRACGRGPRVGSTWSVVEQRIARRLRIADKADAAGPGLGDLAAAHRDAAVVVVDEDRVAADLIDEAVLQRAILRARRRRSPRRDRSPSRERSSGSLVSMTVRAAWRKVSPAQRDESHRACSSLPRNSTRLRRRVASTVALARSSPAGG